MAACRRRVVLLLSALIFFVHTSLGKDERADGSRMLGDENLVRVKRDGISVGAGAKRAQPPQDVLQNLAPVGGGGVGQRFVGGGAGNLPVQNHQFQNQLPVQKQGSALGFQGVGQGNEGRGLQGANGAGQALGLQPGAGANQIGVQKPDMLRPQDVNNVGRIQTKEKRPSKIKISTSPECAADVQKFCSKGVKDNNFSILDCLQNDERTNDEVSETCQHFLWQYKHDLTKDDRFDTASTEVCTTELNKIPECKQLPHGEGLIIPCLIENFENITTTSCQKFLNKMANIIFSDFRFIYRFASKCKNDIDKFQCGRLHPADDDSPHTQGRTVACLAEHAEDLEQECNQQVLRVYELQSDDYHMDRPLYYACQDDRENLCGEVKAGNGAVFQCLYDHLGKPDLSDQCRKMVELRQRLMAQDVRVEHSFYSKCEDDIKKFSCLGGTAGHEDAKRAHVLLCLESAHMDEKKVDPLCIQEMIKVRQRLIEDYRINPDLIARCGDEIDTHCNGLEPGGKTLHCLMGLARDRKSRSLIRDECRAQLGLLLREANVAEDYRMDKPLQIACGDVVTAVCSHIRPGGGEIVGCLMDNIDEDEMTDECEERLLEIQFFVARDFRLDPDLYKSCKRDAKKYCYETGKWADPESTSPDQGPMVLSCLHRHYRHHANDQDVPQLSRACIFAVQRVMRHRASSVDLNPAIEDACMSELGDVCSEDKEDVETGAELECLQLNYDALGPRCKEVIANFTEEESEDIHLDAILMKACTPMIKRFCEDELNNDGEADEVLECLIEHKHHVDMKHKCAVGIEHHQLISLKDFRFNHNFKEACHKSVQTLCKGMTKKYEVVSCLSEHVRNDTLLERNQRVEQMCRKQLKVELLERAENIKLDPELKEKCSSDVDSFCANISPGHAAVLECLKKNKHELSTPCRKLVFKREKEEFAIADYALLHTCKRMIREHCDPNLSEGEILDCLKKAKDEDEFEDKCRRIVIQRQITQATDYRLNPLLQKGCQQDIPKFCADVLVNVKNDARLEGKIIHCLKKQLAIKRLSSSCEHQIRDRVKAAALDIRLSPVLLNACRNEITRLCSDDFMLGEGNRVESMNIAEAGHGRVVECLKTKFNERKIEDNNCRKEIVNLVAESHIDVNVDPLLHTACQQDLLSLCRHVDPGQGRQMSCLLSILDEDPRSMTSHCRQLLTKRKEMWEYAAQVAPPESFGEIFDSMVSSPSKNYFMAILFTVVGIIFIVGISCGRVTKRVRAELKNK